MGDFNIIGDLLNMKTHHHPLPEIVNLNYSNSNQQHGIMSFGPNESFEEEENNHHQRALHFPMMTFNYEIQNPSCDHHIVAPSQPHLFSSEAGGTSHGCTINSIQEYEGFSGNPPYLVKNYGRRKRKRNNDNGEGDGKPKEVVHVRAKRGQATDSHSLAERQRREKINEKLKCLQGLVPGCYKTMGMAVMLDVIINYIRSLQNQIDFLSMKLSAASLFYDFNSSDMDAVDMLHQGTNLYEAQEMGKAVVEGYGGFPQF